MAEDAGLEPTLPLTVGRISNPLRYHYSNPPKKVKKIRVRKQQSILFTNSHRKETKMRVIHSRKKLENGSLGINPHCLSFATPGRIISKSNDETFLGGRCYCVQYFQQPLLWKSAGAFP